MHGQGWSMNFLWAGQWPKLIFSWATKLNFNFLSYIFNFFRNFFFSSYNFFFLGNGRGWQGPPPPSVPAPAHGDVKQ
jgi:hypothetical protein